MFNYALGSVETADNKQFIITEKDRTGVAVYGPYAEYGPGRYVVTFDISIGEYIAYYTDTIVAVLEVTAFAGNTVLAKTNVFASRLLNGKRPISLAFSLMDRAELEFRVHTTGRAPLRIAYDRPVRKLREHEADFSPLLERGEEPKDPFFLNNVGHLRGMYENGASIRVDQNGTIASYSNVSFYMRNIEDFQVANEVFVHNEYTFRTERPCVVIDVGMNVGLTSLYMASIPQVEHVYGFEPFKAPYRRALENFSLNPALTRKIEAHNYGLGAANECRVVLSQEGCTIGTSIKGLSAGIPEEIIIRDASLEIQKIVDEARSCNLDVIVKLDCEGSEFSIFDVLDKHNLLKEIRVFLVEWHKWWSADRTQRDLVAYLTKNDFIIFDHTIPAEAWAGQIYAIRVSA